MRVDRDGNGSDDGSVFAASGMVSGMPIAVMVKKSFATFIARVPVLRDDPFVAIMFDREAPAPF